MQRIGVHRILMSGPGDTSGLEALVDAGTIDPREIVAVMGKTEGNGCVNDFTREYTVAALSFMLSGRLAMTPAEVQKKVAFVMSGGTEGIISPHVTVFTRGHAETKRGSGKRLAVGIAFTRDFLPEEMGRLAQVDATVEAVKAAMADAGITSPADVHFAQVKCPLLTSAKVRAALGRGKPPVTHDTYESMGWSRGASALGVAVALGEVERAKVTEDAILRDWSLFSGTASVSAGIEIEHNVVIVIGMSERAASDFVVGHDVMADAIDAKAVHRALGAVAATLGVSPDDAAARVTQVFAKAEASPDGLVRGARHTMLNDSDINSTRHARSVVSAVIASVVGQTPLYVSGGAEHQGPPGGGPVAVVARV